MGPLENKTLFITGASRGIGRAIAEGFGRHGATVYGTARAESSLDWMAAAGMRPRPWDRPSGHPHRTRPERTE